MSLWRRFERLCESGVWGFFAVIWLMIIAGYVGLWIPLAGTIFVVCWVLWGIGLHIPQKIYWFFARRWRRRKRDTGKKYDTLLDSL